MKGFLVQRDNHTENNKQEDHMPISSQACNKSSLCIGKRPVSGKLLRSTLGWMIPALLCSPVWAAGTTVSNDTVVVTDTAEQQAATSRTVSTTSTKTTTPLSKTPQSVSVVTSEDIEEKGVTSVADSLAYSSGVVTNYRGTSNRNDEVLVRGMSGYVPQYLDGISFGSSSSGVNLSPQVDPWLLEKVELIHGPSSVLYGQSAPGGLLSLTSKRPTATPLHEIEVGYGTDNQRMAAFDFGGQLDKNGKVLFRLTGVTRARDGQEKYVEEERYAIAPSLTFLPNDNTSLTVLASIQKDPKAGYRNFLPAEGTVLSNANGSIPTDLFVSDPDWEEANREQKSIGYLFEHKVNDQLTLRQNMRVADISQVTKTIIYDSWTDSTQAVMSRWAQKFDDEVQSMGLDNQAQYTFATGAVQHTLLGGVDYKHYIYDNRTWSDKNLDGDLDFDWTHPSYSLSASDIDLVATTDETQHRTQIGTYLQDQLEWNRWNLVLSGRYDRAKMRVDDHLYDSRIENTANKMTGRAGVMYTFDNGIAPYASYNTSFEPITSTDANGKMLKPTTARQAEVGMKYAPKDRDLMASVALFDLHQLDVASYDSKTRGYVQTGEVGSKGVELESRLGLTDALKVTASYTFTDAETLKSETASEVGKRPYWIPEHMASLWTSYRFDMGLTTGAGVRYMGTTFNRANDVKVPAYNLVDMALSYDLGRASASLKGATAKLTVSNVLDHEYVSSCANNWACFYGSGRSAMASVNYSW